MPTPRLIHPVDVVFELRDYVNTIVDEDTREPVRQLARKVPITLPGQVLWDYKGDPKATQAGLELEESGYVLVRFVDLRAALGGTGVSIGHGDRINSIGGLDVSLYVTRTRPMGHYPKLGPTLLRCYFADRSPTHGDGTPGHTP